MQRRLILLALVVAVVVAGAVWLRTRGSGEHHYTGFVEGEERIIRSEVTARALEVPFGEGAAVDAGAVVARLDRSDIDARIASRREELGMTDADIRSQEERIKLVRDTWPREVRARQAEVKEASAGADLAMRTFTREQELARTGASTRQQLDDALARRDQATSALDRARDMLAHTEAEETNIALAERQLDSLRKKRDLIEAQIAELEVTRAKHEVRAPAVPTVVQTQFLWPGELAQAGTPIVSVLDPNDKYVQIYVPVEDTAKVRVGQRVAIELDSAPGTRIPGEISFIADKTNFTPEKIETRGDRIGQVYRAKVRILSGADRLQPGAEGNVYLVEGGDSRAATAAR
jgi:multidrug resistance efflux pump